MGFCPHQEFAPGGGFPYLTIRKYLLDIVKKTPYCAIMAPAPGFEPGSSARQAEMIGQATPREHENVPQHFLFRV